MTKEEEKPTEQEENPFGEIIDGLAEEINTFKSIMVMSFQEGFLDHLKTIEKQREI